ncbi:MAG: DUF4234 domain-containing protein [Methylococcales bacterium]|nr:DUF4234 domain-containing protein [Methylococcales bacterium]
MPLITELKDKIDTQTTNLVLLTIATAGIYPILWLNKSYPIIDNIAKTKTADNVFIIWLAVCTGLSSLFFRINAAPMILLAMVLSIAANVLYIVWAFRAKKALQEYALNEHKIDLRMNGFYTFLLSIYYINYCINDLQEAERKQKILSGQ